MLYHIVKNLKVPIHSESIVRDIFNEEMFFRILPTTLLQKFCKTTLYSQVMVNNTKEKDENF